MDIRIDTSIMQLMANTSLRAKNAMDDAMKAANAVVIHDDWTCQERDFISEQVLSIKKCNDAIGEDMVLFSSKVNDTAERFNEFERTLQSKIARFDSSVGTLYGVTKTSIVAPCSIARQCQPILKTESYWEQYHTTNVFQPISIMKFSDTSAFFGESSSVPLGLSEVGDTSGATENFSELLSGIKKDMGN